MRRQKEAPTDGTKLFFASDDGGKNMSGNIHRNPTGVIVEQSCMPEELLSEKKGHWQLENNRLYVVELVEVKLRLATKKDMGGNK